MQEVKQETVSKFKRALEEEITRFRALNQGTKDSNSHLTTSLSPTQTHSQRDRSHERGR